MACFHVVKSQPTSSALRCVLITEAKPYKFFMSLLEQRDVANAYDILS